ncbi:MAG: D-alanyl-D-alanine carboxypeptidase/D-alanyl-D-alanine-endopeptidase [Bacteroidaceae bacterium]|nr:D-alanyl-D-alanine carboxypeptidase/D-alanyl-D-alanine-endopeptidase [Bacteroidaceae bacterium]
MKRISAIISIIYGMCFPALQAQTFAERIGVLLEDSLLQDSEVGLMVYDLDADSLLYAYQENKLYRPASTEKIVTCVAALDKLGADYPIETSLYHTGNITEDSLLEGSLYVIGRFDPLFGMDDLLQMTAAVKDFGINRIEGKLIGNVSMKDTLKWGSGWCWDDEMPVLSPLLCEQTDSLLFMFKRELDKKQIVLADSVPIYMDTHPDSVMTLVYRCQRTLGDLLPRMMKKSDNLYAEAMFYQLAAQTGKPYAQAKDAKESIKELIERLGHDSKRYRIADGSGASLYNYLSPCLLIDFLRYAYENEHIFQPLYESMPIAGKDGTLQYRMKKNSPAYGKVHAKTGTVTGVVSLAGYAYASNGHLLAFAMINQNTLRPRLVRQWQDRVCEELCR